MSKIAAPKRGLGGVVLLSLLAIAATALAATTASGQTRKEPTLKRLSRTQKPTATKATTKAPGVKGGELRAGANATGRLRNNMPQFDDGSYYEEWTYQGRSRERVRIELSSSDFDTFVVLVGPDGTPIAENDDGSSSSGSLLEITLPQAGTYTIAATSYDGEETGGYRIRVDSLGSPESRSLTAGQRGTGRLDGNDPKLGDGSHYEVWEIRASAGDLLSATMESTAFDAYLLLVDPTGDVLAEDDDGGGGGNPRIGFGAPIDGTYELYATSFTPGETGAYSVSLAITPPLTFTRGGDPADRYALVVTVSDYPGSDSDLAEVAGDRRLIEKLLIEDFGYPRKNVLVLPDEKATRANVINAVLHHLGQAGPQGSALLYYSGHGTQTEGNALVGGALDPEPDGMDEALVLYDGLLVDDEVGHILSQLEARNVMVWFDSCFSGSATRNDARTKFLPPRSRSAATTSIASKDALAQARPATTQELLRNPADHVFLAASAEDQLSWTGPDLGASVFTHFLVRALSGESKGDDQPISTIIETVRRQTENYVRDEMQAVQTPHAEGKRVAEPMSRFVRRQ